jgi:serine/threonine protein kinase
VQRRRILLTDFGIARQMDSNSGVIATNFTVGSIAYMAREQQMGSSLEMARKSAGPAPSSSPRRSGRVPRGDRPNDDDIEHYHDDGPHRVIRQPQKHDND